jgi:hypothetical protein
LRQPHRSPLPDAEPRRAPVLFSPDHAGAA